MTLPSQILEQLYQLIFWINLFSHIIGNFSTTAHGYSVYVSFIFLEKFVFPVYYSGNRKFLSFLVWLDPFIICNLIFSFGVLLDVWVLSTYV